MPLTATPIAWIDLTALWPETTPTWRLGIMEKPRGGDWLDEEVDSLAGREVQTLVNTMDYGEIKELELQREQTLVESRGLRWIDYPIRVNGVPDSALKFGRLLDALAEEAHETRSIIIQSRRGVGRSGIIAAGLLQHMGLSHGRAIDAVAQAREAKIPDEQEQWLKQSMDAIARLRQ